MKAVAKFKVSHTIDINNHGETRVVLVPVYRGSEENKRFFGGSPSGNIEMNIYDPTTKEFFKPGHEYYVQFEEVSECQ